MLHPVNNVPPTLTILTTTTSTTVNSTNTLSSHTNVDNVTVSSTDSKASSFWNNAANTKNSNTVPGIGSIQPPPLPPMVSGKKCNNQDISVGKT